MPNAQSLDRSVLDAVLDGEVAAGNVPGAVAVVGDRDGVLYEGATGTRALGSDSAMTVDTVAWIASMTKAITGAAAMQLVEAGKLDLDAPASDVVPQLGEVGVLDGFEADGTPRTRPPARPITLRHLLTHTAGYSYEIWNTDIQQFQAATGTPGVTTCRNAALLTPLVFDPGDRWEYGINIDWAGKMVEAVSGQRLGAYLTEHLLEPLGMTSTAFRISADMRTRLAKLHQRDETGALTPIDLEIEQDPEFEMGGGGLYSTAADYLRFARMILRGGELDGVRVLQPDTVAQMSTNNMGDARVTLLRTAFPPFSNDAEFFPGVPKSWGLSFQINEETAPTGRPAGSLSWAGLANSYYWIDPTNGIAGVYISQILPFADNAAIGHFLDFETAVYRSLG